MNFIYYHYTLEMLRAERERVSKLPANPKNLIASLDRAIMAFEELRGMH